MDVVSEVFRRVEHPQEPIARCTRSGFTSPVSWGDDLVPSAPIERPDRLLDLGITHHEEPPSLHVAAARRANPRFKYLPHQLIRHRVRLQPTHRACRADDLEQIGGPGLSLITHAAPRARGAVGRSRSKIARARAQLPYGTRRRYFSYAAIPHPGLAHNHFKKLTAQ